METNKNIELITLEVLGSLDVDDRNNLHILKKTDEHFPWKMLAEYQNLSALLPSVLKITEQPSSIAKAKMINKLSQIISSVAVNNQVDKSGKNVKEKHEDNDHLEKILAKNKIDWGSLADSKQMSKPKTVSGFEEVKPKVPVSREDLGQFDNTRKIQEDEKLPVISEVEFDDEIEKTNTPSTKLKKYVLVSIILFVISLSLFGYLFIFKQSDKQEVLTDTKMDEKIISAPVEEFVYNNVQEPENTIPVSDVQPIENESKVETKTETKTESMLNKNKNLLTQAPPKLPDPIEDQQIITKEISSTENVNEKEEISAPPVEELIKENEEPTYFVAVEEMPQPIGGIQSIQKLIQYPEIAKRAGIQGKVFVKAFVDEKGNVTSAEIVKGIGGGCDEAALDAVYKTKFTPGKQRGKPVKVQVTISVLFKL